MNRKNMWSIAVLALGVLMLAGSQASADWYTCQVDMTGGGFGKVYIMLTDVSTSGSPAFIEKWVSCGTDTTQANRFLATVLAAINSGKMVQVSFDATVNYPLLKAMYIIP